MTENIATIIDVLQKGAVQTFKVNTSGGVCTVIDFTLHEKGTGVEHNVEFMFDVDDVLENVDITLGQQEVKVVKFQTDLSRE